MISRSADHGPAESRTVPGSGCGSVRLQPDRRSAFGGSAFGVPVVSGFSRTVVSRPSFLFVVPVVSGFSQTVAAVALLDHRLAIAGEKELAVRPPRRDAVGHHPLVELAQVETRALGLLVIAAQLERRHLPEEI